MTASRVPPYTVMSYVGWNRKEHSETFTVTEPSTTGFTVAVNPSLNGLNANDFILLDGFYDNCSVTICHIFSGDKVELDEKFPDI